MGGGTVPTRSHFDAQDFMDRAAPGNESIVDGWPGLATDRLDERKDLAVTTDFRDLFAEVLVRHMGLSVAESALVFPGFGVESANFSGLYA